MLQYKTSQIPRLPFTQEVFDPWLTLRVLCAGNEASPIRTATRLLFENTLRNQLDERRNLYFRLSDGTMSGYLDEE
jgi:hypothetical protein